MPVVKRVARCAVSIESPSPSDTNSTMAVEAPAARTECSRAYRERREILERLLLELSPVQADALRLRFFGGLKFQEIADTMQCSLCTAKNRGRWGLLRLSDLVQEETSERATRDEAPRRDHDAIGRTPGPRNQRNEQP